ncbi:hypothetical protein ET532_026380 [Verminephrobacter sp. Larva24]|nr:hypothetical protein ET532_026380 [Verminephrobacter sp. Larva24]
MGRVRRGDLATMAPANPRRSTCSGIVWRVSCLGDRCTDSRACGRIGCTSAGSSAGHGRAWAGRADGWIWVMNMWAGRDDLVADRLIPVMTDWKLPPMSVNIVYQHRRLVPAKTRAFIDFLVEDFQRQDYERRWASMMAGRADRVAP